MNVLLVAPDSKLPNLALMKLSAWHKARGDTVGWHIGDPDRIYVSVLFTKNRYVPAGVRALYPGVEVIAGGPGYDPAARLPPAVEIMPPDHSLYPDTEYSVGRVTSGCPRKCPFCMVRKLEPDGIRFIQRPIDIWKPGTILRLLDDNILASPAAFEQVYWFCLANHCTIRFEYLDARLITETIALQLHALHHENNCVYISWDQREDEREIQRGIGHLRHAGFTGQDAIRCLAHLKDEADIPGAMYRWEKLRQWGVYPFLMVEAEGRTRRLRGIARRGCRPAIWRGLSAEEVFK